MAHHGSPLGVRHRSFRHALGGLVGEVRWVVSDAAGLPIQLSVAGTSQDVDPEGYLSWTPTEGTAFTLSVVRRDGSPSEEKTIQVAVRP